MRKTIFAIIAFACIISSVLTVVVLRTYEHYSNNISDMKDEVIYRISAKETHNEAIRRMDEEAYANNYTGVAEISLPIGSDELTWNACYINGNRVSAEDYDEWVYNLTDDYCNALSDAEETIEEQNDQLNNITLADWFNCNFRG